MMGNGRTNEKGKAPASADLLIGAINDRASSRGRSPPSGLTFFEGNVDEDAFDSLLDMSLTFAEMEDFHRSVAQGIPETVANPNSFQNPQINMSSSTVSTNIQGAPLLPDWNMNWGQQSVNQGHNATSAGGIGTIGGESTFASFSRPQVNRDISGSSFLLNCRESAPVHTRNNANFNQGRSGIHGNFGGGFLSLRLGGTEDSVSRSQLGSREISDKLKEVASNELKMARARKATGQTLDGGFMGFQSNNSGFSNQFCHESQMTSTNNEVGFLSSLNSWPGSSQKHILHMQQNDTQHDTNIRPDDLDHFRDEKLNEAVSTELKMVHAQKATRQTSGQFLNAGFRNFQSNTSGFYNHFSNMDRMNSINNEVGALGTLNSGLGTSSHHISQMQQNDSRNIRSSNLGHYRTFIGNPVHSRTIGGNSADVFSSQQHNFNKPSEFEKPSQLASYYTPSEQLQYMHSTTANNPDHAGEVISQNATPSQLGIDEPFPKRLGVEFSVRDGLRASQRRLSPMATSFQTTSTDKRLTRLTDHVLRPSVGRTDGTLVSSPINSEELFFAHGQSQNAPIQLGRNPQGAPSATASTVGGQSQKPDLHIRPHHKRSAVVPHPASHLVQRQKITHPTNHHFRPKPSIPVTTALVHPSIPVVSRTQPADPVAARIQPVIPRASIVRHRVPVTTTPAISHITLKDLEPTPKLSGYKCFLCKRDLALTSEGPVYQPAAPPPVAILPCGHSFHDQCLQNITPDDQANDPPCIPCAIGEQ